MLQAKVYGQALAAKDPTLAIKDERIAWHKKQLEIQLEIQHELLCVVYAIVTLLGCLRPHITKTLEHTLAFYGIWPHRSGSISNQVSIRSKPISYDGACTPFSIIHGGRQQPGTQQPGTQQPGTQQPGTQQPGTQQPAGVDDLIQGIAGPSTAASGQSGAAQGFDEEHEIGGLEQLLGAMAKQNNDLIKQNDRLLKLNDDTQELNRDMKKNHDRQKVIGELAKQNHDLQKLIDDMRELNHAVVAQAAWSDQRRKAAEQELEELGMNNH
ncbi:hypothetical protein B0H66DRAFT_538619 [Apodospora peruviana]|uniref:Uncharacterized protein n=1 Tax=Apodospora peruviana TaxID=516989 RepID=A0AAE0HTC3_9PEZI|nr:hypothetical protein B0H66DRAFT_538619 [Apodospora peruviana]